MLRNENRTLSRQHHWLFQESIDQMNSGGLTSGQLQKGPT
jgi:hypothetical protein